MKTLEQIDQEINALMIERQAAENAALDTSIEQLFADMTKDELLAKIKSMMDESPLLKEEVRRMLQ